MPATAADLKFFASATMTDTADGGGPRASTVVQNGVLSNVFPSISAADRGTGRVALRKIYPSVTNTDTAPLLGAGLVLNEVPTDAAVSVWMFKTGGPLTTRAQMLPSLLAGASHQVFTSGNLAAATSGSATLTGLDPSRYVFIDALINNKWVVVSLASTRIAVIRRVISRSGGSVLLNKAMPFSGSINIASFAIFPFDSIRVYGSTPVAGAVLTGADTLTLNDPIKVVGLSEQVDYSIGQNFEGYGAIYESPTLGAIHTNGWGAPVRQLDTVTLWHETATSPATAVNGTAINVGRTNVDQIAIVGANGLEIVRFLAGGPVPSPVVATADLAAGTVTPTNVTGWSQPVTVRHRIRHTSVASSVDQAFITLANALTRDFPAGSVLSTHMPLGDLYARSLNAFAQQAWTRVWSDTLIGSPAPLMYTGLPATTNAGAETDRYAVVFTSATAYDVFSERLGLLGSGTKGANFSPLNSATGAALFTLASANWAADILVGSVLRFNTEAASAAAWVGRTVAPSAASGTVTANVRLTGSVD